MTGKTPKVIFDTNVWISMLIGKQSVSLVPLLSSGAIKLIFTDQLIEEIRLVTSREKLRKYFPQKSVEDLIQLIEAIGKMWRSLQHFLKVAIRKTIFF